MHFHSRSIGDGKSRSSVEDESVRYRKVLEGVVRRHVEALSAISCDKNADSSGKRENGHSADYCAYAGQVPIGVTKWHGTLYSRGCSAGGSGRIKSLTVDFGRFAAISASLRLSHPRRSEEWFQWQSLPCPAVSIIIFVFVKVNVQIVRVKDFVRFLEKINDFIGFNYLSINLDSAILYV